LHSVRSIPFPGFGKIADLLYIIHLHILNYNTCSQFHLTKETDRRRDRQISTDRQKTDSLAESQVDIYIEGWIDRRTDRQKDKHTGRKTENRKIEGQTDRKTNMLEERQRTD
jgi:hypothetical protein